MRRAGARLALVLAVALAGAAAWDGSQRRPLEGESGSSLSGLPRGRAPGAESLTVVQFNIHRGAPAEGESNLDRTDDCLDEMSSRQ